MSRCKSTGGRPYENFNRIGLSDVQVEEICGAVGEAFKKAIEIRDRMGEFWIRDLKTDPSRRGLILRVSSRGSVRVLFNCNTPGERSKLRKHFEVTVRDIVDKYQDAYRVEQPRDTGRQDCGNVYTFELLHATTQTLHKQSETVAADLVRLHDLFADAGYYRITATEMKGDR